MQPSGATKWNQRESTRVVASLDGNVTQRAFHVGVDYIQNSLGGFDCAHSTPGSPAHLGSKLVKRLARSRSIQFEFSRQQSRSRQDGRAPCARQ